METWKNTLFSIRETTNKRLCCGDTPSFQTKTKTVRASPVQACAAYYTPRTASLSVPAFPRFVRRQPHAASRLSPPLHPAPRQSSSPTAPSAPCRLLLLPALPMHPPTGLLCTPPARAPLPPAPIAQFYISVDVLWAVCPLEGSRIGCGTPMVQAHPRCCSSSRVFMLLASRRPEAACIPTSPVTDSPPARPPEHRSTCIANRVVPSALEYKGILPRASFVVA